MFLFNLLEEKKIRCAILKYLQASEAIYEYNISHNDEALWIQALMSYINMTGCRQAKTIFLVV